jgi:hydroxymethylpyrimidine pyrophosphatase-like HAD family hydrolase
MLGVVPSIDLIALDLDGTLLDASEAISPANRSAVVAAVDRGVRVVIVTGRGSDAPLAYARDLGLRDPVICAHGALTKDPSTGHELHHVAIPIEYAGPMIRYAHEHRLDAAVYLDEHFYRLGGTRRYMDDMRGPQWVDAISQRFAGLPVHYKFETWGDFEELAITSADATKERALARVCADFGIAAEQVLALGDSRNDVPMLRWAGIGVAMGNALPEVLEAVTYHTTANDEDGVALAIDRFVLAPNDRERRSA